MRRFISIFFLCCIVVASCESQTTKSRRRSTHSNKPPANCPAAIHPKAKAPLQTVDIPPAQKCSVGNKNGFLLPDPKCTPGAVNPTLTLDVLKDPAFTTKCVRDQATTRSEKADTYRWYGIPKPPNNTGANQTCELDHLISLELGGADTLENIWAQCGPSRVALAKRFFKRKDTVENYLAKQVRDGKMSLADAQKGIATDWTQYLTEAEQECPGGRCK
jgi:hypothetical protein